MTLIIGAGNSEQFIQVSDRRLTANGKVVDDESNKAIIMHCANARLAVGFSGLARTDSFSTREWLLKCLSVSGPPDYTAQAIVERLRDMATREFSVNPLLCRLPKHLKKLSIMFTGYLYHHDPPLGALAVLTNCFDGRF